MARGNYVEAERSKFVRELNIFGIRIIRPFAPRVKERDAALYVAFVQVRQCLRCAFSRRGLNTNSSVPSIIWKITGSCPNANANSTCRFADAHVRSISERTAKAARRELPARNYILQSAFRAGFAVIVEVIVGDPNDRSVQRAEIVERSDARRKGRSERSFYFGWNSGDADRAFEVGNAERQILK